MIVQIALPKPPVIPKGFSQKPFQEEECNTAMNHAIIEGAIVFKDEVFLAYGILS